MEFEYGMAGKWLELLKQIMPGVTRVAVVRDPTQGSGAMQFAAIQAMAPSLRVEITPVGLRDSGASFRKFSEWRSDCDGRLCDGASWQPDYQASSPGISYPRSTTKARSPPLAV